MITPEFILESIIIALILTVYIGFINMRHRKKLIEKMGEDCEDSIKFYFKHPYLSLLMNFGIFTIVTFLLKILHSVIFD